MDDLEDLYAELSTTAELLEEAKADEDDAASRVASYSQELDEIRDQIRELES